MFWSAPLSADLMTSPAAVAIDARKAPEDCASMADVAAYRHELALKSLKG